MARELHISTSFNEAKLQCEDAAYDYIFFEPSRSSSDQFYVAVSEDGTVSGVMVSKSNIPKLIDLLNIIKDSK